MELPTGKIAASAMKRNEWIALKWFKVQEVQDPEPSYICIGLRDISEATQAASDFDLWIKSYKAVVTEGKKTK